MNLELASIQMNTHVIKGDNTKSKFIKPGDTVRMSGNDLQDCNYDKEWFATHCVMKCYGGIGRAYGHGYQLELMDLKTIEITVIYI